MKKSIVLSAALLPLISYSSFAMSLQSLNKDQLIKTFQGNTVTTVPLTTLDDQLVSNAISVYLDKDGKSQGKYANPPKDEEPQTDQGTWTAKNDGTFCITWQHWNDGKQGCVFVYKLGNGYLIVNSENNNFESIVLKDVQYGNQLDSES
ncbi:hypothetical protein [Legionella nagasakiensis]|uniref:hypothetical protein n=1 Tax=Legionella nagasakiensis TaxID=535290 RepID=UPI001056DB41|nr:hypothetical protein [Legionella nagasakiensis]